uniref:Sulfate transport system permease protein CysT n=1 Tax=Pedobesia claviformis TaxID=2364088 RepID=A0A386B0X1_9CHLO|nr:Sulfate ABC transporter permease subunit CysT [Pedobesia claviformis]AYC65293.1 Sulfate ABC transporter permease subunit CysT [Pedobesia claviformis]
MKPKNQYLIITYYLFLLVLPIFVLLQTCQKFFWFTFFNRAMEPVALSAYSVTLSLALCACFINTIFGFIVAWIISRYTFKTQNLWDALIDLPFALPTSVAGFTLVIIYSENGIFGKLLSQFEITVIFSKLGIFIAMLFVSFPFIIRTLQPSLFVLEYELEQAAWSLGASPWITFNKIILPNLLPALYTGITLAFSRSIGEYGSIVIISSNLALKDLITPVLIFQCLEQYDYIGATIIGSVMLIISLLLLFFINILQKQSTLKL